MSCCPEVTAFLAGIGCVHAAKMHAANSSRTPYLETKEDQRTHFREEELHLFPLTELIARDVTAVLRRDHGVFLEEIRVSGRIVSLARYRLHSRLEDSLVRRLVSSTRARRLGARGER